MKIGIVSERLNRPLTGVGTYTQNLLKELCIIQSNNEMYMIDYKTHSMFRDINTIIIAPWLRYLPMRSYLWHFYLQFKLKNNRLDLDIIHSPENSTLISKLKNQKKIITVHDIRQHVFPAYNWETMLSYILLPRSLNTADKIIAVSNSTRQDLINYFKIPEEKITVIHEAADSGFKPLNEVELIEVKRKYNLTFPFILYIGNLAKHKNIPTLIKSFYKMKRSNIGHKLVITGRKTRNSKEIFETINELNLQKEVVFTGYVPSEELPALYNAADLFVYPSLYEGFGLPPLEAMSCGCPVITSNTSSLPEVVGNAGILVNPYDVDGLARAMYEVLSNDELKTYMIKTGLERATTFSWEKCARETLTIYNEVCNSIHL